MCTSVHLPAYDLDLDLDLDRDRDDWRTFRVDRMTGKPLTSFRFTPRERPGADTVASVAGRVPPDIGVIEGR